MKWLAISRKAGKEIVRDRSSLFFTLLFPIIFILIFGLAFGTFTGGNTTYNIAVINLDEGIEIDNNTNINHGNIFINELLKKMEYQDKEGKNTSQKIFNVRTDLSEDEAQKLVENRDITAYVIIPRNFSEAMNAESIRYVSSAISMSLQEQYGGGSINLNLSNLTDIPTYNKSARASIIIQGDPGQQEFYTVSGILESILDRYVEESSIMALEESRKYLPPGINPSTQKPHVVIQNQAMETSELSVFDYMVPGLIVFAILMGGIGVAISLTKEETRGTLTRLKLTKMTSFDMIFGTTIPFTILAVIQVLILLGIALLMGFHYHPNANIGLAIFIALWGCLATVALGLIIASIAKNEDQAGSLAPAIIVPVSFLTGAFFQIPTITFTEDFLGTGTSFELFDWLPWTQCSNALRKVFIYGSGFEEVGLNIVLLIIFTVILFIIGVVLYHKKRLRSV